MVDMSAHHFFNFFIYTKTPHELVQAMVDMSSAAPTETKATKSLATNLAEEHKGKQLHAAEGAAEG